jgi:hypothetical protein
LVPLSRALSSLSTTTSSVYPAVRWVSQSYNPSASPNFIYYFLKLNYLTQTRVK